MSVFSVPFLALALTREQREDAARIAASRARLFRDRELRDNARAAAAALAAGGETVLLPAAQATTLLGMLYAASASTAYDTTIRAVRAQLEPHMLTPEQIRARQFAEFA